MSNKHLIWNLKFLSSEYYGPFEVEGYAFKPVTIPSNGTNPYREHVVTYEVVGDFKPTLMWKGGMFIDGGIEKPRDFIEDILQVISVLTGSNATLDIYKDCKHFPATAKSTLKEFCTGFDELAKYLPQCMEKIHNEDWMKKYKNGFHLIMLKNAANISTIEFRFLSYVVIWELLYALENEGEECFDLNTILSCLMKKYFGCKLQFDYKNPSIFYLLRNQLIHNGTTPLSGARLKYAKDEFVSMNEHCINAYITEFGQLTYAMVLMTLGISVSDTARKLSVFDFQSRLDALNQFGKIPFFHSLNRPLGIW